jgi:hypothetical protein
MQAVDEYNREPVGLLGVVVLDKQSFRGFNKDNVSEFRIVGKSGTLTGFGALCGFPAEKNLNGLVVTLLKWKDGKIRCRFTTRGVNHRRTVVTEWMEMKNVFVPLGLRKTFKPLNREFVRMVSTTTYGVPYASLLGPRQCLGGTVEGLRGFETDVAANEEASAVMLMLPQGRAVKSVAHFVIRIRNGSSTFDPNDNFSIIDRCGLSACLPVVNADHTTIGFNNLVGLLETHCSAHGVPFMLFNLDGVNSATLFNLYAESAAANTKGDPDECGPYSRALVALVAGLGPQ